MFANSSVEFSHRRKRNASDFVSHGLSDALTAIAPVEPHLIDVNLHVMPVADCDTERAVADGIEMVGDDEAILNLGDELWVRFVASFCVSTLGECLPSCMQTISS
ncbi:hypothetical protein WK70_32830 [Burkholderia cepacia]|nr:hypothetical protein WK70_32830 [Burkholderia cepacia]